MLVSHPKYFDKIYFNEIRHQIFIHKEQLLL